MDIDPRTNVVVFQLRKGKEKHLVGQAPTLAEDGVRVAWEAVSRESGARAKNVVALHSEWEPSSQDVAFIGEHFPRATSVTHNFARPPADGWEQAFAEASAVMAAAADSRETVENQLLPVLWSESSPRAALLEALPHWPVASGRLHLALAVVGMTPHGTVGMHHVTHHQMEGQSFNDVMADACRSLGSGLRIEGRRTDDGELLSLSGTLVSAAVCLPDFYRTVAEITGAERIVVGLPCPDEVYVAAADSPLAALVEQTVLGSEYPTTELVPCVLSIEGDRIEVLVEREQ